MQLPSFKNSMAFLAAMIILFLLVAGCLQSCATSKQIAKQSTYVDSTALQEKDDSIRMLTIEKKRLEIELQQRDYFDVEFDSTKCPEIRFPEGAAMLNKDSVQRLVSTLNEAIRSANLRADNLVKINADGSKEFRGQISRFKASQELLIKTLKQKDAVIDSISHVKQKTEVRTITKTEFKEKKVTRFNLWWILIAFLLGYVFAKRRQFLSMIRPVIRQ